MYGKILAAAVEEVLQAPEAEPSHGAGSSGVYSKSALLPSLASAYGDCMLEFETPPSRVELETQLDAAESGSAQQRQVLYQLNLLDDVPVDQLHRGAPRLHSDRHNGGRLATDVPFRATVWKLGGQLRFVALTGEPVADYALRFKGELGWDDTWVSGYNNELLCCESSVHSAVVVLRSIAMAPCHPSIQGYLTYLLSSFKYSK